MRRGPQPGTRAPDANRSRAREAWSGEVPKWVAELAAACDRDGQAAVGRRVDYAPSTVSQVLSHSYRGDYTAVERAVRAALMAERVTCPLLGDIALADCCEHQDKVRSGVRGSELRIRLSGTCPTCHHYREGK